MGDHMHNTPRRGAACFLVVAMLLLAQVGRPQDVELVEGQGRGALVVRSASCEATILPRSGAAIGGLRFGRNDMTDLTAWTAGTWSGCLQEMHTADIEFRLTQKQQGPDRVVLEMEGGRGDLHVRKRFEFGGKDPCVRVRMVFENRGAYPLAGASAPAVCALALPAGGTPNGREYYCLDRGRGPEALTPASILSQLSPTTGVGDRLRWIAVTDPAGMKGLGFVMLDNAAREVWAQRDTDGRTMMCWRYQAVPPAAALCTELLIVPLEDLAAVSGLNESFAADATPVRRSDGGLELLVRMMSLSGDMNEVSIVTRSYGAGGEELPPLDALVFERLASRQVLDRRLRIPTGGKAPAWLLYEVYAGGRNKGGFLVRLTPSASEAPKLRLRLPPAGIAQLPSAAAPGPPEPDETEEARGFLLWQHLGPTATRMAEGLNAALMQDERETLFFGVEALRNIGRLRVAVGGAGQPGGPQRVLHPAAAFLWEVQPDSAAGRMVPWQDRKVADGVTVWIALTLDSGPLEPGSYAARLFVDADGQTLLTPIDVLVHGRRIAPREGFALWYVDTDPTAMTPVQMAGLRSHTVCALSAPAAGGVNWAPGLIRKANEAGMDMVGFLAPGEGIGPAERSGISPDQLCEPMMAAGPCWTTWPGSDEPRQAERSRAIGFMPAVMVRRPDELSRANRAVGQRHVLVVEGCPRGLAPKLVEAGRLGKSDSLWLYLDLRAVDWRKAALSVRSAAWAAAWQGLAGLAVRCDRPLNAGDRQLALWHVLRDTREEAALLATAIRRGADAALARLEADALEVRRTTALYSLRTVVGTEKDALLQVRERSVAFGRVPRAKPGGTDVSAPLSSYAAARSRAVAVWDQLDALPGMPRTWANIYWRGIPLLERGAQCWVIVARGEQEIEQSASALQAFIRERTNQQVTISYSSPALVTVDGGIRPTVIWQMAASRTALAAVRLDTGTWVVTLPAKDLAAMTANFHPEPCLWNRASGVR